LLREATRVCVGVAAQLLLHHDRIGIGRSRRGRAGFDRALRIGAPGLEAAVENGLLAVADQLQCPVDPRGGGKVGRADAGRHDDDVVMRLDAEPSCESGQMLQRRQHAWRIADLGAPAICGIVAVHGAGDMSRFISGLAAAIDRGADVDDDRLLSPRRC